MSEQVLYLCKIPSDSPSSDGTYPCLEWVAYYQPPTWVDQLAITKAEMVMIGGSITGVFAVILAFAIIAKAAKVF